VFSALTGNAPIIANDGAMPDSPVLSPNPPFAGDFQWMFLAAPVACSSTPDPGITLALG
jgi:hypothetical protein